MSATSKTLKKKPIKGLQRHIAVKSKKNPSAFFGKSKDGIDGLAFQKKLRDEWK